MDNLEDSPALSREELLHMYNQFCIKRKADQKDNRQTLVSHGRKYLSSLKFSRKFVIVVFIELIKEVFKNATETAVNLFQDVQQGFIYLEKYGINLIRYPWKREYYSVKLYTSFFKYDVEPKIPIASTILMYFGYEKKSVNLVVLKEPIDLDRIKVTSFELFLAAIELEVMKDIACEALRYTDDFTEKDIISARTMTKGDVAEAIAYLKQFKRIPQVPKEIKLDNEKNQAELNEKQQEEALFENLKMNGLAQEKLHRHPKYPPHDQRSNTVTTPRDLYMVKTRVKDVGSSSGADTLELSDAELYGHGTPSSSDATEHTAMETDSETLFKSADDSSQYEIMTGGSSEVNDVGNDYEMLWKTTPGTLPPPPSYDDAIGPVIKSKCYNDWEIIEPIKVTNNSKVIKTSSNNVEKTLPSLSAMRIKGSRAHFGYPSEHVYDHLPGSSSSNLRRQEVKLSNGAVGHSVEDPGIRLPRILPKEDKTSKGSSGAAMNQGDVGGNEQNSKLTNGYELHNSHRRSSPGTSRILEHCSGENRLTTRSRTLKDYYNPKDKETTALYENMGPHVNEARKPVSNRDNAMENSYEHSTKSMENITKDFKISQLRGSRWAPGSNGKTIGNPKNVCSWCKKIPTHCCRVCNKLCCVNCMHLMDKLHCEDLREHHDFVERPEPSSSEDKDVTGSKKQDSVPSSSMKEDISIFAENVCDFCGIPEKLICVECLKRSCEDCLVIYAKDLCGKTKKEHKFENIVAPPTGGKPEANHTDVTWFCQRCTYANAADFRICAICATSRGVKDVQFPESGSRKCSNCTFGNKEGATICAMCSRSVGLDTPETYI